jgi:hypothetical protein
MISLHDPYCFPAGEQLCTLNLNYIVSMAWDEILEIFGIEAEIIDVLGMESRCNIVVSLLPLRFLMLLQASLPIEILGNIFYLLPRPQG